MPFDDKVAAEVLVHCARHCCICRRYDPLKLQVHHIVPEAEGGESTVENAIPVCLTCHNDIHTKAPFTRRFTKEELLGHRDSVFRLVSNGKLPSAHTRFNIREAQFTAISSSNFALSELAVRLLCCAVESGDIWVHTNRDHVCLSARPHQFHSKTPRERAEFEAALQELCSNRLVDHGGSRYRLTLAGFQRADELMSDAIKTEVVQA